MKTNTLNDLAARAMCWKMVSWGDRQVYKSFLDEKRFQCNVADWNPLGNASQAYILQTQFKVNVTYRADLRQWRAGIADSPWIGYGPTVAEAVTRCVALNESNGGR